ncbi:MAG: hypothetical protein P4L82_15045 [Ancalomicrobiaceae bacterium]|nr:hypothetical protein [Ancalomicrobiaceae bacterium]
MLPSLFQETNRRAPPAALRIEGTLMHDALSKFTVQIEISLKAMQNRLETLNAAAKSGAVGAKAEIRSQLAHLDEQAHKAEAVFVKARNDVMAWTDEPMETIAGWKAAFDSAHLAARAERATRYAEAASQVAIISLARAEQATLEAKLASTEADAARAA